MKNKFFTSIATIIISVLFLRNISLFSMNESDNKNKRNFLIKRIDRPFDLGKICRQYSEEALHCYYLAIDDFKDLENKIPQELLELVRNVREFSHINIHPIKPKSLVEICALKIASRKAKSAKLVQCLRSILFSAKIFKGRYDSKLAQMLIQFHLDTNYSPTQQQLDRSLCTATELGDLYAVSLLLTKGANCNFINAGNDFTPLAYVLRQELRYSHRKHFSMYNFLHKLSYVAIAQLLIKSGAKVDHQIKIQTSPHFTYVTYVFMQTNNIEIFNLFEEQIADKVELTDNTNCNIVINAFKLNSAKFIKRLYANPLFRDSALARDGGKKLIHWAKEFYKGYDFAELFEFLNQNNEITCDTLDLGEFEAICLKNIFNNLDYEAFENFAQSKQLSLNGISLTGSTLLIDLINNLRNYFSSQNLILFIEALNRFKINFFHRDNAGKTALDYAKERGFPDLILQALMITPLIHEITKCANDEHAIKLIEYLASLEPKCKISSYADSKGKTALYYAQELNKDRITEALMAYTISNFS